MKEAHPPRSVEGMSMHTFWVWWDPLLEEYFSAQSNDAQLDPILQAVSKEGAKPVKVQALSLIDAIDVLVPHRKSVSNAALRHH